MATTTVLVLDGNAGDRAFASHALRRAGYEVAAPPDGRGGPSELARAEVVVAELDAAIASHLFGANALHAARLVVATRFVTFLPALGDRVAAVVRKPLVGAHLVDTVSDVLAGRPCVAPTPSPWPMRG